MGERLRQLDVALPRLDPRGYVAIVALALLAFWLPGLDRAAESGRGGGAASPTPAQLAIEVGTPKAPTAAFPPAVVDPPVLLEDGERVAVAGRATPSTRGADRPSPSPTAIANARPAAAAPSLQEQFVTSLAADAQLSQRETGVPASVTLAQAMLESDLGRSKLTQVAKNFFGIKASAGISGPAGAVYMDTWEVIKGANLTVRAAFRAYNTAAESFADHGRFLRDNKTYAEAMRHTDDARLFARLIHQAGYATDPQYSDKLIRMMDRYNLYQYDLH